MATNKENGKRYIGATSISLEHRRKQHFKGAKKKKMGCRKFHRAINKYGEESFIWTVIGVYVDSDSMFDAEKYFIEMLKPEYNITKGGRGIIGIPPHNERPIICVNDGKIFKSIVEASNAYKISQQGILGVCKERELSVHGRIFRYFTSPISAAERNKIISEISEKIRFSKKWRSRSAKWQNIARKRWDRYINLGSKSLSRRVICLSDFLVFDSASKAAEYYTVPKSAMIEHCNGYIRKGAKFPLRKTVGGKKFAYFEQNLNMMVA